MSRQRFRPTGAFVDESIRGDRYIMSCVLAEARTLGDARLSMVELALHGQVHFRKESARRRPMLVAAISALPVEAFAVVLKRGPGVGHEDARRVCLSAIVETLQEREVPRLTLDRTTVAPADARTIRRVRRPAPLLTFEHRASRDEPMLWVADGIAWAVGSRGPWPDRLGAMLAGVLTLP